MQLHPSKKKTVVESNGTYKIKMAILVMEEGEEEKEEEKNSWSPTAIIHCHRGLPPWP